MKICGRCKEDKEITEFTRKGKYYQSYCRPCNTLINKKRRDGDIRIQILSSARYRAKKNKFPFGIDIDDIVVPENCPVLGIKLIRGKGVITENSPSLDKIVPSKGYVKGNIVVISVRANRLKSDATLEELKLLADFYGA